MSDVTATKEALEHWTDYRVRRDLMPFLDPVEAEAVYAIFDAARSYVRMVEPDYEAAMERFRVVTGDIDGISPGDVRSVVDAALVVPLSRTEEE